MKVCGSSPRVRGTRNRNRIRRSRIRFIPASAGNTPFRAAELGDELVHPRECGEHKQGATRSGISGGSSPRVRGTRPEPDKGVAHHRFIPASAGNTRAGCSGADLDSVHPRECGEHTTTIRRRCRSNGSSPRVRGTLGLDVPQRVQRRFIPASAGNTPEHRPPCLGRCGSSPRVRGTLQ